MPSRSEKTPAWSRELARVAQAPVLIGLLGVTGKIEWLQTAATYIDYDHLPEEMKRVVDMARSS